MAAKKKVAVILSGCGVYDGAEIHESVLTLLALSKKGAEVQCFAPDMEQHHVINHLTGEEMKEKRNVLTEAARIARGNIKNLKEVKAADFDAIILPGGFGAAKNLSKWAFSGPSGEVNAEVKRAITEFHKAGKPIAAVCMSPVVVAKSLEGTGVQEHLTVGSTAAASPYDINAISQGMNSVGAVAEMCTVENIVVDEKNKIITSPCYMMEASIAEINEGIEKTVSKLLQLA